MAKILTRDGSDRHPPCPVEQCECGCGTFRYYGPSYSTLAGFECVECDEFYSVDGYLRSAPVYETSDADSGL